jgi:hypothetical protein
MQTEKVTPERCNTPEFDEQYACYPQASQETSPFRNDYTQGPQGHPAGMMQEDYYARPAPIVYSCIPVHVAVPTPAAEGMPEWAGYPTHGAAPAYMADWNAQYQPEVRQYAPQPYMMVQMQPTASQWTPNRVRLENVGLERPRDDSQ